MGDEEAKLGRDLAGHGCILLAKDCPNSTRVHEASGTTVCIIGHFPAAATMSKRRALISCLGNCAYLLTYLPRLVPKCLFRVSWESARRAHRNGRVPFNLTTILRATGVSRRVPSPAGGTRTRKLPPHWDSQSHLQVRRHVAMPPTSRAPCHGTVQEHQRLPQMQHNCLLVQAGMTNVSETHRPHHRPAAGVPLR